MNWLEKLCFVHGLYDEKFLHPTPMDPRDQARRANHGSPTTVIASWDRWIRHRPALDESLRLDVGSMTPFLSDFLPRSSCDEAIHLSCCLTKAGLLRCARNDGGLRIRHQSASRAHPTPSLCNTQRGQTYPSYALYRNIAKFIG